MDMEVNETTPPNVCPVFIGEQLVPLILQTRTTNLGPTGWEISETLDLQGLHASTTKATKMDVFSQGMCEKLDSEKPPADWGLVEGLL